MHRSLVIFLICVVFTTGFSTGCSEIHEPWVVSDAQLVDERSRPEEASRQLRDRLARGQIDR